MYAAAMGFGATMRAKATIAAVGETDVNSLATYEPEIFVLPHLDGGEIEVDQCAANARRQSVGVQ